MAGLPASSLPLRPLWPVLTVRPLSFLCLAWLAPSWLCPCCPLWLCCPLSGCPAFAPALRPPVPPSAAPVTGQAACGPRTSFGAIPSASPWVGCREGHLGGVRRLPPAGAGLTSDPCQHRGGGHGSQWSSSDARPQPPAVCAVARRGRPQWPALRSADARLCCQSYHEGHCPFMLTECPACKGLVRLSERDHHSEHECPERSLSCQHCGAPCCRASVEVRRPSPGPPPFSRSPMGGGRFSARTGLGVNRKPQSFREAALF